MQILSGAGATRFSGAREWRAALANPRGAERRLRTLGELSRAGYAPGRGGATRDGAWAGARPQHNPIARRCRAYPGSAQGGPTRGVLPGWAGAGAAPVTSRRAGQG